MNINDYKYIVTIAELGSFTKAAQELYIAQPSLSQRVKHIEDDYEIHIFLRDKKGLQLTSEGEMFVRYAKKILQCEEDLKKEISDMRDFSDKPLKIGAPQFINSPFFNRLVRTYHQEFPKSQLEFIERPSIPLQQLLLSGEIDLAICYLPIESPDLKYELILDDNFVVVPATGSELEKKIRENGIQPGDTIDVSLLDGEPFTQSTPDTMLYKYAQSLIENEHIKLDICQTSKNFALMYSMAKNGIATTILDESFFDPDDENHIPYYYLDSTADNCLSVAVVWRKDAYLSNVSKNLILTAKAVSDAY